MSEEAGRTFTVVFAIWPGMTHLDFTGPHQVLSRLPNAAVIVASPAGGRTLRGSPRDSDRTRREDYEC